MTMEKPTRHDINELSPHLALAFKSKTQLVNLLVEAYGDMEYLQYVDGLIRELLQGGVTGVQTKLNDADNLSKFDSVVSELEIARLFARNGKRAHLLADNAWKGASPDMMVSFEALEPYVEVKRITDDGAANRISVELRRFLPTLSVPVRVDVSLKPGLIAPVTTLPERSIKNERADDAISAFEEQLSSLDLTRLPVTVQTPAADFTLLPTSQSTGYPGVTSTPMFSIPKHELIQKMINDVEMKSKKRNAWKGDRRNHPYIIALVDEFAWTDYTMVKSAFLGQVTVEVGGIWSNPPALPKVVSAANRGWQRYLADECLLPNKKSRCYLLSGKEGAFLTREAMSNVSGVLVRVISGRYYLLPNPFASEEISVPALCDLLSLRISGF